MSNYTVRGYFQGVSWQTHFSSPQELETYRYLASDPHTSGKNKIYVDESIIIRNTDTNFISIKIVDDVIGRTMTNLQMICLLVGVSILSW
jgi:hypothetical protein